MGNQITSGEGVAFAEDLRSRSLADRESEESDENGVDFVDLGEGGFELGPKGEAFGAISDDPDLKIEEKY